MLEERAKMKNTAKPRAGNRAVIEYLRAWMKDTSGYDERVWPEVKAALEEDRLSDRKLFDG